MIYIPYRDPERHKTWLSGTSYRTAHRASSAAQPLLFPLLKYRTKALGADSAYSVSTKSSRARPG